MLVKFVKWLIFAYAAEKWGHISVCQIICNICAADRMVAAINA